MPVELEPRVEGVRVNLDAAVGVHRNADLNIKDQIVDKAKPTLHQDLVPRVLEPNVVADQDVVPEPREIGVVGVEKPIEARPPKESSRVPAIRP